MAEEKRKPRQVESPKEDIAQNEVLICETATTQIKEIIVADIKNGVPESETVKKLNVVIATAVKQINDPFLKEELKQTLIANSKGWYFTHLNNMKVFAIDMARELTASGNQELAIKVTPNSIVTWKKEEKFRPFLDNASKGLAIIDDYEKKVKNELLQLSANPPISQRVATDGTPYKVNLRNRAEMKIRHDANVEDVKKLQAEGVDLVWTSSHADCSKRCEPYQGRLFSISGKSGKTKSGVSYSPLQEALEGPLGDGNGIINGYNCRHRLIEYFEGSRSPVEYSKEEIARERKIDTRQRQYENNIRNLKAQERLFRASGDSDSASALRKRWQRLTSNYERYSNQNGRAYSLWRTRISNEEVQGTY